jgi:glycosyltransferase involved in cell wall biosynthesis
MPDRVTFSVVVPTRGRSTLRGTLASITEQLEPGDEAIVRCSRDEDFGNLARQSMIERAKGTHLVFMDDDDQFATGALVTMRRFAAENPGRIGIFRMRYLDGRILWTEPVLRLRNVSSQMLCVPNVPGKLGRWESPEYERIADYEFVRQTVELQGEPMFREEIVAHIRSDRRPVRRLLQRAFDPVARLRYKTAPATRLQARLGRRTATGASRTQDGRDGEDDQDRIERDSVLDLGRLDEGGADQEPERQSAENQRTL